MLLLRAESSVINLRSWLCPLDGLLSHYGISFPFTKWFFLRFNEVIGWVGSPESQSTLWMVNHGGTLPWLEQHEHCRSGWEAGRDILAKGILQYRGIDEIYIRTFKSGISQLSILRFFQLYPIIHPIFRWTNESLVVSVTLGNALLSADALLLHVLRGCGATRGGWSNWGLHENQARNTGSLTSSDQIPAG